MRQVHLYQEHTQIYKLDLKLTHVDFSYVALCSIGTRVLSCVYDMY